MCGILAIVSFNNHRHNLSNLDEMARMIKHRGPDDEGFALFSTNLQDYKISYGNDTPQNVIDTQLRYAPKVKYQYTSEKYTVGLAHRRLSIIDLTPAGHQPMCEETERYWIVYNGEVYNYRELREDLKKIGYSFISNSDTEVILKSYIEWGEECQNKFNGMWTFIIWDNTEKRLWISRDRLGVKPLYYMFHDDFFIVCSEMKCIMPVVNPTPNFSEINAYIVDGPSEAHSETFFHGVYRFPAGHSSTYSLKDNERELRFQKYWELGTPVEDNSFSNKKLREYAEQYYYLLKDAVKIRLYADVQVGCALSGGLDSSTITYFASNIKELSKEGGEVVTFSNVYRKKDEKYCDESEYIDMVVNYLGVRAFRESPGNDMILDLNDKGLWHEENCYDKFNVSAYNTYSICKKNGIKVALDGQGADEQLAGYKRFWYNYFSSRPKLRIEYAKSFLSSQIPLKMSLYYAFFGRNLNRNSDGNRFSVIDNSPVDDFRKSRNILFPRHYLDTVSTAANWSMKYSLKKLLRQIDGNSMAWSVESRQPFMDYRLVEFLNSLPDVYKLHGGWTKYISRIALKGKLPDEIIWRKDKKGWPMPLKEWVSGDVLLSMKKEIQESILIMDLSEMYKQLKLEGNRLADLHEGALRYFLRYYNVARVGKLFFGY